MNWRSSDSLFLSQLGAVFAAGLMTGLAYNLAGDSDFQPAVAYIVEARSHGSAIIEARSNISLYDGSDESVQMEKWLDSILSRSRSMNWFLAAVAGVAEITALIATATNSDSALLFSACCGLILLLGYAVVQRMSIATNSVEILQASRVTLHQDETNRTEKDIEVPPRSSRQVEQEEPEPPPSQQP